MTAIRRIQKELADLTNNPIPGITIDPNEDNILLWACKIQGSADSPYKGGTFKLKIEFPDNFPFKAPAVTFLTKIYHPGINEEGAICVQILRDQWKPTINVATILATIQEKLGNPQPDDPFEPDIAAQLKNDKPKFQATAKEWTKKYAM